VRERRHHTADDEHRRQLAAPARREPASEVEHVLEEGEPHAGEPGVDEAVHEAVELAPPQQEHEQHGRALQRLLRQRGHDQHGDARIAPGVPDRLQRGGVDDERAQARDARSPGERERQQRGRLGLVAVEPEKGRHDGEHRDRGQRRAGDHTEDSGDRGDLREGEQPAATGDDDDRHPREDAAQPRPRRRRQRRLRRQARGHDRPVGSELAHVS
jgi:hypothetical protein